MPEIKLDGCTPEPLMNYLKAMGVFRLVAEQADAEARLSWRDGVAHLYSKLERDRLAEFFLNKYRPTPIVVPWSGSDFFAADQDGSPGPYDKTPTGAAIIGAFLATTSDRLADYRETLKAVFRVMRESNVLTKSAIEGAGRRKQKKLFLVRLRANLPDQVIDWMDAATQLAEADEQFSFNPLLGSGGGSDGNTHFSDNFMQNLWDSLPDFTAQRKRQRSSPDVRHALFNELVGDLTSDRSGALFDSGAVEGANATQGLRRPALMNPWNFVLGLEGSLAFAGGVAKRLGTFSAETSAFPFTVQMTTAGFGSAARKEAGQKEVWVPVWYRPFSYFEFACLMREGRAQLNRRPARNGTDFSRAVAALGVSAGVDEFVRYGFIRGRVGGENYYTAAALGRFRVHHDPSVTLLEEIDPWLTRLRIACENESAPSRYSAAFRRLDDVIVESSREPSGSAGLQAILRDLGNVERCLADGRGFRTEARLRPLQGLSGRWLDQANDGSAEFRLAAALAGIRAEKENKVGPLRAFLEEVEVTRFVNWSPGSTSSVWSKQSLANNLAAVFRRRQMEAFRTGQVGVPLYSPRPARLADVLAFLNLEIDDDKLHELLWGLIAIELPNALAPPIFEEADIPFEFGVPRLLVQDACFLPNGESWRLSNDHEANAKADPDVFHVLASGRKDAVEQCVDRAARRLKSGGLLVTGYRNRRRAGKSLAVQSPVNAERLLAAMLFPLSHRDLERIAKSVLYPPESEE